MVKDHSDSEKGNLLPPHRLLLSINSKGSALLLELPQIYDTFKIIKHYLRKHKRINKDTNKLAIIND